MLEIIIIILLWLLPGYISYIIGEKFGTETSYPFFKERSVLNVVFCTMFGMVSLYWLGLEIFLERRDK